MMCRRRPKHVMNAAAGISAVRVMAPARVPAVLAGAVDVTTTAVVRVVAVLRVRQRRRPTMHWPRRSHAHAATTDPQESGDGA